jgi:hypothetical protein
MRAALGHLHHLDPLEELLLAERRRFAAPMAATDPASLQGGGAAPAVMLPYLYGANKSESTPFETVTQLLDTASHEYEADVTPGGFLRGIEIKVSSVNGVLGTANLTADAPFSVLSSITLEDISGEGVLKPMSAFAHMVKQKWFSPWDGDPSLRAGYSRSVNPAFTLRLMVEVRDTLGVLANTDARAQYRVKFTIAALAATFDVPANLTTPPTVTVKISPLKWAQTDAVDLLGNPISPTPLGLSASRFFQHQMYTAFGAGDNTPRLELVGNEIRALGFIVRNSLGARVDLSDAGAGTITFAMDDRTYWKRTASQWVEEMASFYQSLGDGRWTRETGVYIVPRFRNPGLLIGEYWLQTVEQNNLNLELLGGDLGANVPGSIEILYDNLAVDAGVVLPGELEGI